MLSFCSGRFWSTRQQPGANLTTDLPLYRAFQVAMARGIMAERLMRHATDFCPGMVSYLTIATVTATRRRRLSWRRSHLPFIYSNHSPCHLCLKRPAAITGIIAATQKGIIPMSGSARAAGFGWHPSRLNKPDSRLRFSYFHAS